MIEFIMNRMNNKSKPLQLFSISIDLIKIDGYNSSLCVDSVLVVYRNCSLDI